MAVLGFEPECVGPQSAWWALLRWDAQARPRGVRLHQPPAEQGQTRQSKYGPSVQPEVSLRLGTGNRLGLLQARQPLVGPQVFSMQPLREAGPQESSGTKVLLTLQQATGERARAPRHL